jgi:CheY-like chemotaxis protein
MGDHMDKTKNPHRILIVDDNADAAHMLCVLLEMIGHDTRAVNDPKTAIPLADASPPGVFILDIGMPGMDGYALGRELKKKPFQSDLHRAQRMETRSNTGRRRRVFVRLFPTETHEPQ